MPRKKKSSHGEVEAKNRTKRLVQISMRAEEYTYHNKKIPAAEAHSYLVELRRYDENCVFDVRSRQVIEKLTRMMIEIIQDEQENAVPDLEQVSFTQMTNVSIPAFKIPYSATTAKSFETENKHYKSPKQNFLVTASKNIKDTIDLCCDDDEPTIDPLNKDVSVATAIGNLNIQDLGNAQPMLSQLTEPGECSQSILTNFDNNTCAQVVEAQQLKNNNQAKSASSNRPLIILKRQNSTPIKVQFVNSLGPLPILKSFANDVAGNPNNNAVKYLKFDLPKQVNGRETNVTDTTPVTSKAPMGFAGSEKYKKIQPKVKISEDKIKVKKTPRKKATPKCKNIECLKDHDYSKPIIKRRRTTKSAKTAQATACVENKKEKIMHNNWDHKASKQCKKHIVEDLSWVENLKYVRITETNEFCSCDGYEESFWRNLDYPPDWDDMLMLNCFQ